MPEEIYMHSQSFVEAREKLNIATKSYNEAVDNLKNEIDKVIEKYSSLNEVQKTFYKVQKTFYKAQEELDMAQEELDIAQEKFNTTTKSYQEAQKELDIAQEELAMAQEEFNTTTKSYQEAQEKLDIAQEELYRAQEELAIAQGKFNTTKNSYQEAKEKLDTAKEQLDTKTSNQSNPRFNNLQEKLNEMQKNFNAAKNSYNEEKIKFDKDINPLPSTVKKIFKNAPEKYLENKKNVESLLKLLNKISTDELKDILITNDNITKTDNKIRIIPSLFQLDMLDILKTNTKGKHNDQFILETIDKIFNQEFKNLDSSLYNIYISTAKSYLKELKRNLDLKNIKELFKVVSKSSNLMQKTNELTNFKSTLKSHSNAN